MTSSSSVEESYPKGHQDSELFRTYPELYKAVFVDKRNVLISGPGGTGKSFAIGLIKKESLRLSIQCDLTSTTGVSAHGLGHGASTIHRWSGIKLGDKPIETILSYIRKKSDTLKRWKGVQILVIDEVSMLGDSILTLLDRLGKELLLGRKELKRLYETKSPVPSFGGVQIIFSADFMQLLPIKDQLAFKSPVWNQMNLFCFRTTHPYRYPDPAHFELLQRVRVGEHTAEDIEKLKMRVVAYEDYRRRERAGEIPTDAIKPTRIYPLRADVDALNLIELEKLEGDSMAYEAADTILIKTNREGELVINPDHLNTSEYIEIMDGIAPSEILLKPNAQVMLTVNLCVEEGLVNGARGIITECHDERIVVLFKSGAEIDIIPHAYEFEDDRVQVVRHQFPLILAWAITLHKSQGATLDWAILDLGTSLFAAGMGYVGLSRCKTIEGVLLLNLMPARIRADPEALAFEKRLAAGSALAPKIDLAEPGAVEVKRPSLEEELAIEMIQMAIDIEKSSGCNHTSGMRVVCKLCRQEKKKAQGEKIETGGEGST